MREDQPHTLSFFSTIDTTHIGNVHFFRRRYLGLTPIYDNDFLILHANAAAETLTACYYYCYCYYSLPGVWLLFAQDV